MAVAKYYVWISDGRPYRLMTPAAALQRNLRRHGLTVYDYPDDDHLQAEPAEDHTPFAGTGWPVASAYGIGHAVDIMPRTDNAAGRRENAAIARRLIADRNANVPGVMWIKYINWTDEQGICRQERWMPNHTTRSSSDKNHVHVSGRSDCDNDTRAANYDPLGGDDMEFTDVIPGTGGLTVGLLFQDLATHTWVQRGLTLDASGIPQRHPQDRWTQPHLLAAQTTNARVLAAKVDVLTAMVQALADAIAAGGGNVDTAAIFHKIDEAVAALNAEVDEATAAAVAAGQEARDAVGDSLEGGAPKVREDAGPGSE
jgi:hypothetical protein